MAHYHRVRETLGDLFALEFMGILRLWLATLVLFNPNHIGIGAFNSFIFSKAAVLGFFVVSGFYLQYITSRMTEYGLALRHG